MRVKQAVIEEYTQLYEELFPRMVWQLTSFTHNTELSTDLVQDVFVRVWETLHKGKQVTNLRGLLWSAFYNKKIDWFRKKSGKEKSLDWMMDVDREGVDHLQPIAPEEVDHEGSLKKVIKMLQGCGLKPIEVDCLGMWCMGMPPRDIAPFVGREANVVSVTISRAIAKLR